MLELSSSNKKGGRTVILLADTIGVQVVREEAPAGERGGMVIGYTRRKVSSLLIIPIVVVALLSMSIEVELRAVAMTVLEVMAMTVEVGVAVVIVLVLILGLAAATGVMEVNEAPLAALVMSVVRPDM